MGRIFSMQVLLFNKQKNIHQDASGLEEMGTKEVALKMMHVASSCLYTWERPDEVHSQWGTWP